MNPQIWPASAAIAAAYAALLGGIYVVMTQPLLTQLRDIIERLARIETKPGGGRAC